MDMCIQVLLVECKKTQKLVKEINSVDKVKEIIKKWQIDIHPAKSSHNYTFRCS